MTDEKTVVLGSEFDDSLYEALRGVLVRLGGEWLSRDWGIGGSQEIATERVRIGAGRVTIESETYVGLSIRGPSGLVDLISGMVKASVSEET